MAVFQGLYRRNNKFVAVSFIRLSASERIAPGTKLPSKKHPLKPTHLASLFRQRKIGIRNTPWVDAMLEKFDNRIEKEAIADEVRLIAKLRAKFEEDGLDKEEEKLLAELGEKLADSSEEELDKEKENNEDDNNEEELEGEGEEASSDVSGGIEGDDESENDASGDIPNKEDGGTGEGLGGEDQQAEEDDDSPWDG